MPSLGGLATGCGGYLVGVGVGLFLQPVAFLLGGLHGAEAVGHFGGHVGFEQVDAHHRNAAVIAIERRLHFGGQAIFHFTAIFVQDRGQLAARHNVAHRRFGHSADRVFGVFKVEQELGGIVDVPHHLEFDIHDVLVARQHQAIVKITAGARANIGCALLAGVHDHGRNKRPRRHVQTIGFDLVELAQKQLDRFFFGLHGVK